MSLAIRVETVELPGGGTALRAVCCSAPQTSRGNVIAIVDQAEHGSTEAVARVLEALAVKLRRHGYSPQELL